MPEGISQHVCACIGPPKDDGDPRCVCARLAAEEGHPWPEFADYEPPKKWPDDFRGFGIHVKW